MFLKNVLSVWVLVIVSTILGCSSRGHNPVEHHTYLASFSLDDSTTVEVLASLKHGGVTLENGVERVFLTPVSGGGYSVPVFGGALVGEWVGEGDEKVWVGEWIDSLRVDEYRVPLKITPIDRDGDALGVEKYSAWDTDLGRLKMTQRSDSVFATFLTSTGDYRYLAGVINPETTRFKIGTFDGVHLFSFEGDLGRDSITDGVFKSGTHYYTTWEGVRAVSDGVGWSSSQAWNPESEVIVKGVNSRGEVEVWTRERLRESGYRVLVVDVMGTWCPNCMDEARLLKALTDDYPKMIVVSMAFERSSGKEALNRIANFKADMGLPWDMLLGGRANKGVADSVLSFIGGIKSFPTTVFIPIEGELIVHSGFSGPATGDSYEEEVRFFKATIESFIQENH